MRNRLQMGHPDDGQLLRYADGELAAGEARRVRSHLEACWECRAAMAELQRAMSDCVRYRNDVMRASLPEPPLPWQDIYRGFDRVDAARNTRTESRLRGWFRIPVWAAAAAAVLLSAGLYLHLRQTPSVQAAELLRKAVAAANARPPQARRIRIRSRRLEITRRVGAPAVAYEGPVRALFTLASYDWDDPLSALAFESWRQGLIEKQDEVHETAGSFEIRTRTSRGQLAQASLKLRSQDLEPVESRLDFRDGEWLEITRIEMVTAPAGNPVASASPAGASAPIVVAPAPSALSSEASAGDELRVLGALHRVGADLGDPVEVTRANGRILVEGVGVPSARQRQIREALAEVQPVEIRFSDPVPSPVQSDAPATAGGTPNAEVQQLQMRLEKQLGGRAEFDQFCARLLDFSEMAMARVYALRRLAERFPQEAEAQLSPVERQTVSQWNRDHAEALARLADEMEHQLEPLVAVLPSPAMDSPSLGTGSWQMLVNPLFASARRLETSLAVLLGATPGDGATASQLLPALRELQSKSRAFRSSVTM